MKITGVEMLAACDQAGKIGVTVEELEELSAQIERHPYRFGEPSPRHVDELRRCFEDRTGAAPGAGELRRLATLLEVAWTIKTMQLVESRRRAARDN
jgi:hypothetical protein